MAHPPLTWEIKFNGMATKIKWKKMPPIGNVKVSYQGSVYSNNQDGIINIIEIRVFRKGEYVLPVNWFPHDKKTFKCQTTKTLEMAKKKCQKWFDNFIKANQ